MGDKIFTITWCVLAVWTGLKPDGYGPYVLLGFNGGDFLITLLCGLGDGYLKEEGDLNIGSYLMSTMAFALLGGFYASDLSFQPGSDAYNNAVYFIFASFWLAFGFRYLQYGLIHLLKRS